MPGKSAAGKTAQTPEYPLTNEAIIAPILGWIIPGAGHIYLKRYVRGLLLLISVFAMFFIGLAMNGRIYKPNGGDILDILGFVGDVGAGGLYFLARIMDWGNAPGRQRRRRLRQDVYHRRRPAELHRRRRRAPHRAGEKTVTLTSTHFSAAVVVRPVSPRSSSASRRRTPPKSRCATASTASPCSSAECLWRAG